MVAQQEFGHMGGQWVLPICSMRGLEWVDYQKASMSQECRRTAEKCDSLFIARSIYILLFCSLFLLT